MYNKLLNKNVISAILVTCLVTGYAHSCRAQGVVSLVEEDNALPQNNTADIVNQDENFNEFGFEINAELPDTIEEEVIPLNDEALISPESTESIPETSDNTLLEHNQEQAPETENILPVDAVAETANPVVENTDDLLPPAEQESTSENFDLGLDKQIAQADMADENNVKNAVLGEQNPLNVSAESEPKLVKEQDFANSVLAKIDNDLFAQMSDIEKQTTLLTLELRREKIRNEIEAIKAQRVRAEEEKAAAQKQREQEELEKQKEEELKIYREKQILKDKEIELEKIKQRKALSAYMNKVLEDKQVWIQENTKLLKRIRELETDREEIVENFKKKLNDLNTLSDKFTQSANSAKSNHDRTVASLTAQNVQLKKRLETEVEAMQNAQNAMLEQSINGNVDGGNSAEEEMVNISQEYAVLDIVGNDKNLVAKIINKEGITFSAKKGTVLLSGFVVEQITPEYILFSKQGVKQYLYTGTTVEPELLSSDAAMSAEPTNTPKVENIETVSVGDKTAPTLGAGMFVK